MKKSTLAGPIPGHADKSSLEACIIPAKVLSEDPSDAASVLFTPLTAVRAAVSRDA